MGDLLLAYESLIAFVGINGLLALSVYATLCCGQLSLANAGFMAIGAYTGALITLKAPGVPFIAVLAASTLAPAIVAVPLGLPVLRLRGVFLAIATVGFGEVVRLFFVNWDYTNGALGLVAIPQRTHLWSIALALALALYLLGRLRGSRTGTALEAIREDETAALGGTAAFYGPVLGAAFLTVLPELMRELGARLGLAPGPFRLFLNGAILLAVILYLPNGLVSLPSRLRRRARGTA